MTSLGKYELHEQLGKGGFGIVYRATDTSLNRVVAVKVLHPQLMIDEAFIDRFRDEARLLAALDNRHIVTIYNIEEIDGRTVFIMRYLPGGNLKQLIEKRGPLPFEEASTILLNVLDGLKEAHDQGLIHRDLKPENILLSHHGEPVITDLGLARQTKESGILSSTEILGTPSYIAPEIWNGEPATPASDIYSLGCILYEMLTGTLLFDGDTPGYVMTQHLVEGPQFKNAFPPQIRVLLDNALAKDPARRYKSVEEFARAIQALVQSPAQPPRPLNLSPSPPGTSNPPEPIAAQKKHLPLALLAAFIVIGVVIVALVTSRNRSVNSPSYKSIPQAPVVEPDNLTLSNEQEGLAAFSAPTQVGNTSFAQAPGSTPTKRSATITPTIFMCPGMPPSQVKVGDKVEVCSLERLILRQDPDADSPDIRRFEPGTKFELIDGPVCADGSTWWKALFKYNNNEYIGWVKEGTDPKAKYYICVIK